MSHRIRGHRLQQIVAGAFLLAAVIGTSLALERTSLLPGWRFALALLPIPFAVWVIRTLVRELRCADEFQRHVMLESLAIAYPCALLVGMIVEYLQKGGFLVGTTVGDVWPIMGLLWVPALYYAKRSYRS